MIFRHLNSYQLALGITLLFCSTSLFAEVTVNNLVKNDRVISEALTGKNVGNVASLWELHAEQWEIARSGASVLSLPVLNSFINAWLQDRKKIIEIQYPGGEEGELWVQELTDWLVSLGIPSASMLTVAGSGADDMIRFNLIK